MIVTVANSPTTAADASIRFTVLTPYTNMGKSRSVPWVVMVSSGQAVCELGGQKSRVNAEYEKRSNW